MSNAGDPETEPTAPQQETKTPFSMPARKHHSAPVFDGEAESLPRFFDDFERLADKAELDDKERISQILRYLDLEDEKLWKGIPEATGEERTWKGFKDAIEKLYPGAQDDEWRYEEEDLRKLVAKQTKRLMESEKDLGKYKREFLKIHNHLKKWERISERETYQLFMSGFPSDLQQRIKSRLSYSYPNQAPRTPHSIERVAEAAKREIIEDLPVTTTVRIQPVEKNRDTTLVKQEPMDMQSMMQSMAAAMSAALIPAINQTLAQQNEALAKAMAQQSQLLTSAITQQAQAFSQALTPLLNMQPPTQATGPPAPRYNSYGSNANCLFCGNSGHHMNSCLKAEEYIGSGKCKRLASNGRIVLPDNGELGRNMPGYTLQEKVDNWFANNPASKPATSAPRNEPTGSLMYEVREEGRLEEAKIEEVEEEIEVKAMLTWEEELAQQEEDATLAMAQQILEKRQTRSATAKEKQEKEQSYRPFTGNPADRPSDPPKSPKNVSFSLNPTTIPSTGDVAKTSKGPQYTNEVPIVQANAARLPKLYEALMSTPVPGVTVSDLLAFAPSLRAMAKEDITTKRVPVNSTAMVMANMSSDSTATHNALVEEALERVARRKESLRVIFPKVNGEFEVECILDSGCQIVVVRKDVWMKTGLPLLKAEGLVMEAANAQTDKTMGMVEKMKFTIGGFDYWIPCDVVDGAPFEVLMGRPFTVLAKAITQDLPDGGQEITIHNTRTGKAATIPTFERICRPPPGHPQTPANGQDF